MHARLANIAVLAFLALSLMAGIAQADHSEIRVALLLSDSLKSTVRTVRGAKKVIEQGHPDVEFSTFVVSPAGFETISLTNSIEQFAPTLVLTVGSIATGFAKDNLEDFPIVFSAVKYPVLSGFVKSIWKPGGNLTGASLNIPENVQFKYFKKIVPGLKRLGVLYSKNTAPLISQAKVVARSMGIELLPILINENKELPAALDSLAAATDGIWSLADPNLFKAKSTKYIITKTLRRRIPFMGFSRNVVASGALFSLDFDYKAIGFQAGQIANRIINGESPATVPVSTSDVIWFHYNEKTAKHIKIVLPDELIAVAKEVYR